MMKPKWHTSVGFLLWHFKYITYIPYLYLPPNQSQFIYQLYNMSDIFCLISLYRLHLLIWHIEWQVLEINLIFFFAWQKSQNKYFISVNFYIYWKNARALIISFIWVNDRSLIQSNFCYKKKGSQIYAVHNENT